MANAVICPLGQNSTTPLLALYSTVLDVSTKFFLNSVLSGTGVKKVSCRKTPSLSHHFPHHSGFTFPLTLRYAKTEISNWVYGTSVASNQSVSGCHPPRLGRQRYLQLCGFEYDIGTNEVTLKDAAESLPFFLRALA